MSDGPIQDQPSPIARPDEDAVWPLVVADVRALHPANDADRDLLALVAGDMTERDAVGRQRYGTPLTANNGRDHLIDAYQELLDACVYLRAHIVEHPDATHVFYTDVLVRTIELRRWIGARRMTKS